MLGDQPAEIQSSAYAFRADRTPEQNPPESWILLTQYANLPFDKPVDPQSPALQGVLSGLLWEEVRPIRQIQLTWPAGSRPRPTPDQIRLAYFDTADGTAHTWWNPRTVKEAGPPRVAPDGRTWVYSIPVDTCGVVTALRGTQRASTFDCPVLRAFVPDTWKELELEIEWVLTRASQVATTPERSRLMTVRSSISGHFRTMRQPSFPARTRGNRSNRTRDDVACE
jgi:hypothetical protein